MEKYFSGDIDIFELSQYYLSEYDSFVKTPSPPSFVDLETRYKEEGLIFFDNFSFNKEDYDVILIEDKIEFEMGGALFVAKPDLVLRNKETKENILYDYKTSMPFRTDKHTLKEKTDTKKIDKYITQMYVYSYALREIRNIPIKSIILWFTRAGKEYGIEWEQSREEQEIAKILDLINQIKTAKTFPANNSNSYFCNYLCGVRNFCEFRD
jgi:hypothetical protein